ncbi:MAG: translocation/assembly module TamB domain-containing protein, partial [Selenomonadaceae bacterium]
NYRAGGTTENSSELANIVDIGLRMSFLSAVDSIVRNAMQVDEFNIVRDTTQVLSEETGVSSNKEVYNVEIGKYISDKYMLKYTQGIGYNKNKVTVQYDVNDRIGLTGSVDSNNKYIMGIEARFKF